MNMPDEPILTPEEEAEEELRKAVLGKKPDPEEEQE